MPMFWGLFALVIVFMRRGFRHREPMEALESTQRLLEKGVAIPSELADALRPDQPRIPHAA